MDGKNNSFENTEQTSSLATGGHISNGMIFNSSGTGSIGIVKLLAFTGIGLLLWRVFRGK